MFRDARWRYLMAITIPGLGTEARRLEFLRSLLGILRRYSREHGPQTGSLNKKVWHDTIFDIKNVTIRTKVNIIKNVNIAIKVPKRSDIKDGIIEGIKESIIERLYRQYL